MIYQHFRLFTFLLSFLSVIHLPLIGQENEDDCCSTTTCSTYPPEYNYDHAQGEPYPGSRRLIIAEASAVVAGAIIGGIIVSLSCRHHGHSHSSSSNSAYSSLINEEFYNDNYNYYSYDYSDYSDYSGFSSDYSEDYSRKGVVDNTVVVVDGKAKCVKNKGLIFEVEVKNPKGALTASPFVKGPDGLIIEGEPLTITQSTRFSGVVVQHPEKGLYEAGLKILSPKQNVQVVVHVIDHANHVEQDLDSSGTYQFE